MNNDHLTKPLVEGLVYAPIYKKAALMQSGKPATGKNPFEESYDREFGPADVVLALKRILIFKQLVFLLALEVKVLSSLMLTRTMKIFQSNGVLLLKKLLR